MGFPKWLVASIALASITLANKHTKPPISRPELKAYPLDAGIPFPHSPKRCKTCFVPDGAESGDDSSAILEGFKRCNKGGNVVLDGDYTIGKALDLTFLEAVDVIITGTVAFSPDINYWVENSFKYEFQNSSAFWRFGGKDVNIYGGSQGVLDGQGQAWWDALVDNSTLARPILLVLDGLDGGSVSGIHMRNSPNWFNLISDSNNILVTDMNITVATINENPAKNGDGWDTYRSDNIVIQNSWVDNSDDCVSFKPNSTNVIVQNMHCNGSHGISVGSLGQYAGEFDIVENLYIYNISMTNAGDGARIKIWPGADISSNPGWVGGGGGGYVRNVTYDLFYNYNNALAIEVNQCYGQRNQTLCNEHPSNMTISDVLFKNMWGVTSDANDPRVGSLICSSAEVCNNIAAQNISVTPPSGEAPLWTCVNMDETLLDFTCVPPE